MADVYKRTQTQPVDQSTMLTRAISEVTALLGSFPAILLSAALVTLWFIGGLFVGLGNNTYQLLINTTTTIVTFLMVFIIQNTQNRDGAALQAKLDAQSHVLRAMAQRLGCEDEDGLLMQLVGVEDAPAKVIREDDESVRRKAIASGRHGRAREERSSSSRGQAQG